jgi:hypothetical protein
MEHRLTDAETAALKALVEIIKTNPRAVRIALDLATEADMKAQQLERDQFERWRADVVKRQAGRS